MPVAGDGEPFPRSFAETVAAGLDRLQRPGATARETGDRPGSSTP